MKNLFKSTLMVTLLCLLFVACKDTRNENEIELETARQGMQDAEKEAQESSDDSMKDYEAFREQFEMKINENEKHLEEAKKEIKASRGTIKLEKEKELSELEARNVKLKAQIQDFEQGSFENWEMFKTDLNKEMDEVSKSISEMANKNPKN